MANVVIVDKIFCNSLSFTHLDAEIEKEEAMLAELQANNTSGMLDRKIEYTQKIVERKRKNLDFAKVNNLSQVEVRFHKKINELYNSLASCNSAKVRKHYYCEIRSMTKKFINFIDGLYNWKESSSDWLYANIENLRVLAKAEVVDVPKLVRPLLGTAAVHAANSDGLAYQQIVINKKNGDTVKFTASGSFRTDEGVETLQKYMNNKKVSDVIFGWLDPKIMVKKNSRSIGSYAATGFTVTVKPEAVEQLSKSYGSSLVDCICRIQDFAKKNLLGLLVYRDNNPDIKIVEAGDSQSMASEQKEVEKQRQADFDYFLRWKAEFGTDAEDDDFIPSQKAIHEPSDKEKAEMVAWALIGLHHVDEKIVDLFLKAFKNLKVEISTADQLEVMKAYLAFKNDSIFDLFEDAPVLRKVYDAVNIDKSTSSGILAAMKESILSGTTIAAKTVADTIIANNGNEDFNKVLEDVFEKAMNYRLDVASSSVIKALIEGVSPYMRPAYYKGLLNRNIEYVHMQQEFTSTYVGDLEVRYHVNDAERDEIEREVGAKMSNDIENANKFVYISLKEKYGKQVAVFFERLRKAIVRKYNSNDFPMDEYYPWEIFNDWVSRNTHIALASKHNFNVKTVKEARKWIERSAEAEFDAICDINNVADIDVADEYLREFIIDRIENEALIERLVSEEIDKRNSEADEYATKIKYRNMVFNLNNNVLPDELTRLFEAKKVREAKYNDGSYLEDRHCYEQEVVDFAREESFVIVDDDDLSWDEEDDCEDLY